MRTVKTADCNNEAKGPGLKTLPIYENGIDLGSKTVRVCTSYWKPNKEERKLLNKGGVIALACFGVQIPVNIQIVEAEIIEED